MRGEVERYVEILKIGSVVGVRRSGEECLPLSLRRGTRTPNQTPLPPSGLLQDCE